MRETRFLRYALVVVTLSMILAHVTASAGLYQALSPLFSSSPLYAIWHDDRDKGGIPLQCETVPAEAVGRCVTQYSRLQRLEQEPEIVDAVMSLERAQQWQAHFYSPSRLLSLREHALMLNQVVGDIMQGKRYEGVAFQPPAHVSYPVILQDVAMVGVGAVALLLALIAAGVLSSSKRHPGTTWSALLNTALADARRRGMISGISHAMGERIVIRAASGMTLLAVTGSMTLYFFTL